MWTAFDYMYRDAANFKAFGTVVLTGDLNKSDRLGILDQLDGGECFIAEQVGVSPLYEELYRWSRGRTASDHCWHEFVGFRELGSVPDKHEQIAEAAAFAARFRSIAQWDGSLSPHF